MCADKYSELSSYSAKLAHYKFCMNHLLIKFFNLFSE